MMRRCWLRSLTTSHYRRAESERDVQAKITLPGASVEAGRKYAKIAADELVRMLGRPGPPLDVTNTSFCRYHLEAPNQPRPLRIQRADRKHLLAPMNISFCVDGHTGHASVHIAGCAVRWQTSLTAFDVAQWATGVILPVLEDHVGILRVVRRQPGWCCYDGLPSHIASDHMVDVGDPKPPASHPDSPGNLCEAILWTWSGRGDRHVVLPQYAE